MAKQSWISLDKVILIIGLIIYGTGFSLLYIIFAPLSRSIGLSTNQFGILIAISNVSLVFSSFGLRGLCKEVILPGCLDL